MSFGGDNHSPSTWTRIDELCDEFERLWVAGQRRPIEDFIERAAVSHRTTLVRELIILDVSYLRRQGDAIDWESYAARFPEFVGEVADARRRFEIAGETAAWQGKP